MRVLREGPGAVIATLLDNVGNNLPEVGDCRWDGHPRIGVRGRPARHSESTGETPVPPITPRNDNPEVYVSHPKVFAGGGAGESGFLQKAGSPAFSPSFPLCVLCPP